ncbi:thioredoxin domain-containing protein [Corynebacterium macginleyi]|uniref:Thioredoxin domain-containing protein n=1 Tax=Corynebacterium macginleyi TaxID=38290 RepID=A0A3M0G8L0_9CORY|nr:thioredoxin domain-containing protein [Corynebacterium macginleyi]MBK4137700.1 thioredoxin domain-containing protein [Corynebacterium macginleyi]MBK4140361.1 thioredoxin domain-containing protein [Corynebacterium macginleyi]MBK4146733.1 thioredoxin domain-containing protein [Corynebacterium macginleyi]MBK4149226.1 thioredoxin domain-containing protein [Corynebacterium macginleyi]MBK4150553.1 thioredoxin domain-containing protein [Corynebacterium macginleyi]
MSKVSDPNAKSGNGFIWGVGVLLVVIAVVIGYIVWNGKRANEIEVQEVNMSMDYKDNAVTLKSDAADDDTPEVDLYEDFSCSHCADLAISTDADMKQAIEDGKLVVHVRTLNFLDGRDIENEDGYSTKAAAAMSELAKSGDVKTYWNLRDYMMQNQQSVATQWDIEDIAEQAKELGAEDDVVDSLRNVDIKQGNKVAKANYDKLNKATGSVSSPRIIQNGKDIPDRESGKTLNDWVDVATK